MLYCLHFSLIMAGYSACGILLGSYMMRYAGATELDLGFIFMIQPLTVFTRPLICAQADRHQTHKRLLLWCVFADFLAYIPFIILPFLLENPKFEAQISAQLRFWLLVACHVIGSFAFTGIRCLGDALACNYAKRVDSDFTSYRKYGAISFGTCGFLLGLINQNWILPDFVPSFIVNVVAMFLLTLIIYSWPDEYFVMYADTKPKTKSYSSFNKTNRGSNQFQATLCLSSDKSLGHSTEHKSGDLTRAGERTSGQLLVGKELASHICGKLLRLMLICVPSNLSATSTAGKRRSQEAKPSEPDAGDQNSRRTLECVESAQQAPQVAEGPASKLKALTAGQQAQIFWLLVKRDIRIPLFLLLLLYGGLVGYAPPNFVFTYMNVFCHEKGTCDAASLAGLTMISYCVCETICYMIIKTLRRRINYLVLLQITLASLCLHYYFYGFLLPHLPPYFFLVESLHGLEYSSSLSASVELAYRFANEVEILIPELVQLKIIRPDDDIELVKVSLMATMSGCFTLIYDGIGCIIGSFIFGLTTDYFSFTFTWLLIGTLAAAGFVTVGLVVLVGRCLNIRPQIYSIQAEGGDRQRHSIASCGERHAD